MSDYSVFVKGQAKVFLAGPPLVKMATNEVVDEENLGGAEMHSRVSGVSDYLAEDEYDGIRLAREIIGRMPPLYPSRRGRRDGRGAEPPAYPPDELLGILSPDIRQPYDSRELVARVVDGSRFSEFKPEWGSTLVTGFAEIHGFRVGILANNGVLFSEAANKGAHFIQLCNQNKTPLIFFQNITGYMFGRDYERAGITKDGAKMIMAQSCSRVPKFTVMCNASFGAGNYGMCGRAFDARFLFGWPSYQIATMGADQAVKTLADVKARQMARNGEDIDETVLERIREETGSAYEHQLTSYYATSRIWDDGLLDPLDTRNALGMSITASLNAPLGPSGYGVFRF